MKNNKLLLATVLLSTLGFSAVSNAAEPVPVVGDSSSAFIQWSGFAKVIPGDAIVITGLRNGPIEDGTLTVNGDGTFKTKTPIDLESRFYWDQDGSGVKTAGDLFATNWTIDADGITAAWGTNSTDGMMVKMIDTKSTTELTTSSGPKLTSAVTLAVNNDSPVTSAEDLNLLEPLTVTANVIATIAGVPNSAVRSL